MDLRLALVCTVAVVALTAPGAAAATYVVDRPDDVAGFDPARPGDSCTPAPSDCTLRDALRLADLLDGDDEIVLGADRYELSLTGPEGVHGETGDLDYGGADGLTIRGAGAASTVVDANGIDRVLDLDAGTARAVRLENLTLTGGSALDDGGGLRAHGTGPVTLTGVVVEGNTAGSSGGGVFVSGGTLRLQASTVRGNAVTLGTGGGVASWFSATGHVELLGSTVSGNTAGYGGGLALDGTHVEASWIVNTTISGNTATSADGGGVRRQNGDLAIRSSTIAGNAALTAGGGVSHGSGAALVIANSVLSGNTAAMDADCQVDSGVWPVASLGHNVLGASCAGTATGTDALTADPRLGPLADNFGAVATRIPLPGGPALDWGDPVGCSDAAGVPLAVDARGEPRAVDGDADGAARCDAGAAERIPTADLRTSIGGLPAVLTVGEETTVTVRVGNGAADTAPAATATIELPPGVVLSAIAATRGACTTAPAGCAFGALPALLPATVTMTLVATAPGDGAILATAAHAAREADPASDRASARLLVQAAAPPLPPPPTDACTITGTPQADVLHGTPGRDVICGLGGDDVLIGLDGDDVLRGGAGRDRLLGGGGRDDLRGGPGDDWLDGQGGADRLRGDGGSDTLVAVDHVRDRLDGGRGRDRARRDPIDAVRRVERRF